MKKRAVTLIELIIAVSLIGVLFLTIGITASTLYTMKKDVMNNQQELMQGTQASLLIFERILRAEGNQTNSTQPAFIISAGNTSVEYNLPGGPKETIYKEGDTLKYCDGAHPCRTILNCVSRIRFANDYQKRLAVDIDMCGNQTIRTCVQPRNAFSPRSTIN